MNTGGQYSKAGVPHQDPADSPPLLLSVPCAIPGSMLCIGIATAPVERLCTGIAAIAQPVHLQVCAWHLDLHILHVQNVLAKQPAWQFVAIMCKCSAHHHSHRQTL